MAPLLTVAAVASAVAGAVSAAASIASGEDQAAVARHNAEVASASAQNAQSAANSQGEMQSQMTERQMGQIASAYGGAGVQTTGSPLAVMSDQAAQGELQRQLTQYRGTLQAQNLQQQAGLNLAQGNMAATSGFMNAGTTLLTTGSKVAGNMYYANSPGAAGSSPMVPG